MEINVVQAKRTVDDYDFTFVGNVFRTVTVDTAAGDTIDFDHPGGVRINLVSRPHTANPEIQLPAEEITVFSHQLLWVQHRIREIEVLTPEQRDEWVKTLKEASGVIH